MTAEIAVMNQSAVALAADSAATRSGAKIFAANKIFAVSKYEPVAAMVYGSASCMSVPWETIIKEFRANLDGKGYSTVRDYGQAFLRFLASSDLLFPDDQQDRFATWAISHKLVSIREAIVQRVDERAKEAGSVGVRDARRIARETIHEQHMGWRNSASRRGLPRGYLARLRDRYGDGVDRSIDELFENLNVTREMRKQLAETIFNSWTRGTQEGLSGVVFAGFGRRDVFPALVSYEMDGVLLNHPLFWPVADRTMGHNSAAVIVPFAQQDMIRLFVEGVTPRYEEFIEAYFSKVVSDLGELVTNLLPDGSVTAKLEADLNESRQMLLQTLAADLGKRRHDLYVDPLLSIVGSLPMDELASLAESLVNLTSLRRRVSLDEETVGGPIDVAVISRGDGLIWIKRKHYFKPELNHQFFSNYYRSRE
jgi:hypothetical protein